MAAVADFVVEVRDVNYVRQGQIDPTFLDLKYTEVFRSVGKWELKLPSNHPMLPTLKAKGSGIIVTRKGSPRPFSGRMQTCTLSQDAEDPRGTWVVAGVDDNVVAAATCTYPSPSLAASAQATDYWTYTAAGETVMKQLVLQNIGAAAQAARKYPWLTVATDLARGSSVSASTRFDSLADMLTALGIRANLGWRFYQAGTGLTFEVFVPADKTALIRLDIRNGGLESTELGYTAPSATQALVLGQGEGTARTVRPVTSTASLAEATSWGLRWEVVKDERNTDVAAELEQAGQEILTEQGTTVNSLKVVPSDGPNQTLGIDWDLGDLVTVVIDGTPATATVTEVARSISSAGVITQATVGDPVGFDWEAKVSSAIKDQDSRISSLEATVNAAPVKPPTNFSSSASRDAAYPTPTPGTAIWRSDKMWEETYLTTPLVRVAGWYPTGGFVPHVSASSQGPAQAGGNSATMAVAVNDPMPLKFVAVDVQQNITYSVSTGLATITQPGLYRIQGAARPTTITADNRIYIQRFDSGAAVATLAVQQCPQNNIGASSVSADLVLDAGAQIAPAFFSAVAQTINAGQRTMSVRYLGPA
jgi:hypothetical protein